VSALRTLKWTVYGRNLWVIAWSINHSRSVTYPNTKPTSFGSRVRHGKTDKDTTKIVIVATELLDTSLTAITESKGCNQV